MGMDAELSQQLEQARLGDVQAFGYVAAALRSRVLGWAREVTGDSHAAEDAAQEALVIAFTRLAELRELHAFPAWLRAIVRSAALKQQQKRRPDTIAEPEAATEQEDAAVAAELRQAVQGAVHELSDAQGQVIERHYLQGQKIEEIAAALGLPAGTVKRRLHDAREKLRVKLAGFNPQPDEWRG
jgi:RNA polymerase sigma factor (sigma-70 family)